jgi:hypothetical protein
MTALPWAVAQAQLPGLWKARPVPISTPAGMTWVSIGTPSWPGLFGIQVARVIADSGKPAASIRPRVTASTLR